MTIENKLIGIGDVLDYTGNFRIKNCPCCGYETDCVAESSGGTFSTLYCGNCCAKVKIESNIQNYELTEKMDHFCRENKIEFTKEFKFILDNPDFVEALLEMAPAEIQAYIEERVKKEIREREQERNNMDKKND